MLVFSSAQTTNSSAASGCPSNTREYKSNATAAFGAKFGSRGKIHDRWNHGRIASRSNTRHTVEVEIAATTSRPTSSRASSAQLHRDSGTPEVAQLVAPQRQHRCMEPLVVERQPCGNLPAQIGAQ